ncbi:uncharacterized protein B0T23DRAFT_369292 [Neurospora hispaniola]|uniref:Uncharacterized protein n=1 Tax=Neurospora hispaniola TaxID=588809 RepID=A0AAJ0IF81_9PEZI|nr:hypothetical protein B0T23DRAFT_369292 [Neurospora hispaniola]
MVVSPFRVVVGTYTSAQRSKPRRQAKTGSNGERDPLQIQQDGFCRSACVINEELIRRMILVNITSAGGDRLEVSKGRPRLGIPDSNCDDSSPRKDRGKDNQSSRADEEVKEGKSRACVQGCACVSVCPCP